MATVIQTDTLGKRYTLGVQSERYKALRDSITRGLKNLVSRQPKDARDASHIWALRDVSFEVGAGEVVGIIGGNGAGKSTLLKIISEITDPTEGTVRISGRVGSLLEVGTGFHPELTGRENVYLNGAVLGMTRGEIRSKFDEIVDFSGVEQFLDTPLKRYSSGMAVRLAFAVAAHLEPEILLVDEVLAVGDAEFQKKCLGRMKDVTREGRTVLFVSHNMPAVQSLCGRVILLEGGRVVQDGSPEQCVRSYLGLNRSEGAQVGSDLLARKMEGVVKSPPLIRVEEIALRDSEGFCRKQFRSDEAIEVGIRYRIYSSAKNVQVSVFLVDEENRNLMLSDSVDVAEDAQLDCQPGAYESRVLLRPDTFGSRTLHLTVHVSVSKREHLIFNNILDFEVRFQGYNAMRFGAGNAYFRPRLPWTTHRLESGDDGDEHLQERRGQL